MTVVEFLAERYNFITWMRNRDEISAGTADEWRDRFLKEAKEMEEQQELRHAERCKEVAKAAWDEAQYCCDEETDWQFEEFYKETYEK